MIETAGGKQISCMILYRHCASFNVILRRCNIYFFYKAPSGSFMVDMGIPSNIMKSPSPKYYMTFWDMVIYSDTLN